jgi:hypothetical protein
MNFELLSRIRDKFKTQVAFAFALGESDNTVSKVVRGWRPIPDHKKEKWARALDCKVEDIDIWEPADDRAN